MSPEVVLNEIINPACKELGLYSVDAAFLLLGTCAQESHLGKYRRQIGGPALSIFQIEPATEHDVWYNFLRYHPKFIPLMGDEMPEKLDNDLLFNNDIYAAKIARLIYYRVSEKLPDHNNVQEMARYWKKYYNTPKGKGTEAQFIKSYEKYIG